MLPIKKDKPIPSLLIERDEAIDAFRIFIFENTYEEIKSNARVGIEDQQEFYDKFSKLQNNFKQKYRRTHYEVMNYLHFLSEVSGASSISVKHVSPDEINKIDEILKEYTDLILRSETEPVRLGSLGYGFKGFIYSVTGKYTDDQIRLLILEDFDKENKGLDKAIEFIEKLKEKFYGSSSEDISYNRPRIPESVRIEVWRRDGGKCARCGSREKLEYDHIVPISKGGSNTARNIELLCERHNRSKSNNVV